MGSRASDGTVYVGVWLDDYDGAECGVYGVWRSRGRALDFLADTVFERAETVGVDVRDPEDPKREMTKAEVRDYIANGCDFPLVLSRDWYGNPTEQVSVGIRETEMAE